MHVVTHNESGVSPNCTVYEYSFDGFLVELSEHYKHKSASSERGRPTTTGGNLAFGHALVTGM